MELRNHIANLGAPIEVVLRKLGTGPAFALLAYYAARCGRSNVCWPGLKETAEGTGICERMVKKYKAQLVAAGAITSTGGGGRHNAEIRIVMGWCHNSPVSAEDTGAVSSDDTPPVSAGYTAPVSNARSPSISRPVQDQKPDPRQEQPPPRSGSIETPAHARPLLWGGDKLRLGVEVFTVKAGPKGVILAFEDQPTPDVLAFVKAVGCRYKKGVHMFPASDPFGGVSVERAAWVIDEPSNEQISAIDSLWEY